MGLRTADRDLVQIVDAAFADAERRAGPWLVCRPGCTQCCYGAFAINELDVLRLSAGMESLRSENPTLAVELERRASVWLAEHGADFPGDLLSGRLGNSEGERAAFVDFANEAACPALDPATGRCAVYEWRPMTCRVFGPPIRTDGGTDAGTDASAGASHALGHCELCFIGATAAEVAACEMPVPHQLEQGLLDEIPSKAETVVAFALLRKDLNTTSPSGSNAPSL